MMNGNERMRFGLTVVKALCRESGSDLPRAEDMDYTHLRFCNYDGQLHTAIGTIDFCYDGDSYVILFSRHKDYNYVKISPHPRGYFMEFGKFEYAPRYFFYCWTMSSNKRSIRKGIITDDLNKGFYEATGLTPHKTRYTDDPRHNDFIRWF